jgi:hypothetical protein
VAIKPLKNRLISFITLLALALFGIPPVWAAVSIDRTVSGDGTTASTTVSTPPISTSSTNELLLAFVLTDYLSGSNTTVQRRSHLGPRQAQQCSEWKL